MLLSLKCRFLPSSMHFNVKSMAHNSGNLCWRCRNKMNSIKAWWHLWIGNSLKAPALCFISNHIFPVGFQCLAGWNQQDSLLTKQCLESFGGAGMLLPVTRKSEGGWCAVAGKGHVLAGATWPFGYFFLRTGSWRCLLQNIFLLIKPYIIHFWYNKCNFGSIP